MSSKSSTVVTQEDKSVSTAAEAGNIIGAEGSLTEINPIGTSVVVSDAPNTTLGDIVVNQFPEAVRSTVSDLIRSVDSAVSSSAQAQMASTEALGQKLSDLQIGEASLLPKLMLYGMVALVLIPVVKRFLK